MAHCNKCQDGINEDTGLRCQYCDGTGNVPDDDDFIAEGEDTWQPCADCDRPDACADFGCAIEQGIRRKHLEDF